MADDKEKEKEKEPFFKLYNLDAVEKIKRDEKIELPQRKLSIPKDERWNEKQMASKTMQGILNGDSIKTISKSMEEVVKNNEVSAMRIARTMHTSAENAGRLQSFKDLAEQGVVQKKVWQATPDDRVRASHLDIDGEEQDIDKPFSNGCMFPGDGKGPSDEVWNCRCAMSDHIIGFRRKDGSISEVKYKGEETLHDKQIREERTRRGTTAAKSSTPKASSTVVNGKDITDTWTRREDQFDFEIEDVINAQGFDGLPQVVPVDEFDKYVQEANDGNGFIAQRTYSAPNQETLDAYREQLYNGKWYVDCSTGGAQYGQGMYCAADYEGTLTKGMQDEMKHYQDLGMDRNQQTAQDIFEKNILYSNFSASSKLDYSKEEFDALKLYRKTGDSDSLSDSQKKLVLDAFDNGKYSEFNKYFIDESDKFINDYMKSGGFSYTETLTLDKSAKIISYDDLVKMKDEDSQKWEDVFWDTGDAKGMDIRDKIDAMDIGSYAAMKGYDAINAEGHGESGSYTVILNRTKVIIKEDK